MSHLLALGHTLCCLFANKENCTTIAEIVWSCCLHHASSHSLRAYTNDVTTRRPCGRPLPGEARCKTMLECLSTMLNTRPKGDQNRGGVVDRSIRRAKGHSVLLKFVKVKKKIKVNSITSKYKLTDLWLPKTTCQTTNYISSTHG